MLVLSQACNADNGFKVPGIPILGGILDKGKETISLTGSLFKRSYRSAKRERIEKNLPQVEEADIEPDYAALPEPALEESELVEASPEQAAQTAEAVAEPTTSDMEEVIEEKPEVEIAQTPAEETLEIAETEVEKTEPAPIAAAELETSESQDELAPERRNIFKPLRSVSKLWKRDTWSGLIPTKRAESQESISIPSTLAEEINAEGIEITSVDETIGYLEPAISEEHTELSANTPETIEEPTVQENQVNEVVAAAWKEETNETGEEYDAFTGSTPDIAPVVSNYNPLLSGTSSPRKETIAENTTSSDEMLEPLKIETSSDNQQQSEKAVPSLSLEEPVDTNLNPLTNQQAISRRDEERKLIKNDPQEAKWSQLNKTKGAILGR